MKSKEEPKEIPIKAADADEPDGPQATDGPQAADGPRAEAISSRPAKAVKAAKKAKPAKIAKASRKIVASKAAKTPVGKAAKTAKVKPTPATTRKAISKAKTLKSKAPKPTAPEKPKPSGKSKTAAKADLKSNSKPNPKSSPKPPKDETAKILDSKVVYEGKLFRVLQDHIIEPGGRESHRDVIRHNGSVVILAVDPAKRKKDPWVVIERQYRHAAGQFLWELPAGKLDAGETPLAGAIRELAEETGYQAKKWTALVEYFASPGFLGESMKVFLAEGLIAGDAHPEADEHIDFRLVKLSDLLEMVDKGKIIDGKTLTTVLLYARQLGLKRKK
jgi:ADP-ribose pyrophosphatase